MNMETSPKMMHSTYFTLPMGSNAMTVAGYIAAAQAGLHLPQFMESFWIGGLAQDIFRTSSDRTFHISMNQIFANKDMFDKYAAFDPNSPYIAEVNRWAPGTSRRVLDSFLSEKLTQPPSPKPAGPGPSMCHSLYFSLTNNSTDSIKAFTDVCLKFLTGFPGLNLFAIGNLADLGRNVSVNNYDVALNMVWQTETDYNNYEASNQHKGFFPASKGMIKNTYIFDSYIVGTPII